MVDITDEPLDRPLRQLRSAILARAMFYQADPSADPIEAANAVRIAAQVPPAEPPIFEGLVALTYWVMGKEVLWVARVYASLIWILGALALFHVTRRATSDRGGLVSLAFYLFVPSSVLIGRVFQPDPLMLTATLVCVLFTYRWVRENHPPWAALAGLAGGLAILIKPYAAFLVFGAMVGGLIDRGNVRASLRRRETWAALGLAALIPSLYYLAQRGAQTSGYAEFWFVSFVPMLAEVRFYTGWVSMIRRLLDFSALWASLAGVFLFAPPARGIAVGLWVGYALYGMSIPWATLTHDYYTLPVLPVAAFSLAPIGEAVLSRVVELGGRWRAAFALLTVAGLGYASLLVRNQLVGVDYRSEPAGWRRIAQALPTDGAVIALTHEYGYRLMYYGERSVEIWPYTSDLALTLARGGNTASFDRLFDDLTQGMHYFLVTEFGEFQAQSDLHHRLCTGFELVQREDAYFLFDLHRPTDGTVDLCAAGAEAPFAAPDS